MQDTITPTISRKLIKPNQLLQQLLFVKTIILIQ